MVVGFGAVTLGLLRKLRDARGADTDRDFLGVVVGERLLEFLAERLPPIHALSLIGHGAPRPRHRLIELIAILIGVHLDAPDARLRFRQYGAGLEIADSLFERLDAIEQHLRLDSTAASQ